MNIPGDYFIEFDRTGFPLIRRMEWPYSISLFPVSKYQFERFMADQGPKGKHFTDEWYREFLKNNPRGSWKRQNTRSWEIFITAADKDVVNAFLKYLGKGYRLPKTWEWRSLLHVSGKLLMLQQKMQKSLTDQAAPPVSHWIQKSFYPLMREGLLEIVTDDDTQRYIGRPWPGILPNMFSPDVVRDVNWDLCAKAVGFRVVKENRH